MVSENAGRKVWTRMQYYIGVGQFQIDSISQYCLSAGSSYVYGGTSTLCGSGFPPQESVLLSRGSSFFGTATGSTKSNTISSSAQTACCHQHKHTYRVTCNLKWRTCNLLDGTREPLTSAESPEPEGVGQDDADGNRGVVERLRVDRVEFWEAKDDRDEGDPEHRGDSNWVRELAEVERSSHESVRVNHAQGNG